MKRLFLISLLSISCACFSQTNFQAVDRKQIEKATTDEQLPTYYSKLIARLNAFDSTLTKDDYRLIYYGFVFQKKYSPYAHEQTKEIKTDFEKKDFEKVVTHCNKAIANNPVDLKKYYYKLLALLNLDRKDDVFLGTRRTYSALIDAIIGSGDGLACNTAYKVISVSDEYEVMYRYFEVEKVLSQSLEQPCDKINITPSKQFSKTAIYFDVSESFLAIEKNV